MKPVTVIMRTKNSGDILPLTLKALYSQNAQDFELLVIDSASTDNTLEIASQFPCKIKKISAHDYYPGKVLNEAIAEIQSPLVVFLNSDAVLLTPTSLKILLSAFNSPLVQAAFGRQVPRTDAKSWVKRDYATAFPSDPVAPEWMPLSLAFAAMRRSAWEKRPFYTLAWGSEDAEWGMWARKEGYSVKYVSNALAMHSHNYTLKQIYGRRFIEGEADAFIFRGSYSLFFMLTDIFKSSCRDLMYALSHLELKEILPIPFRRSVYYWAYYKGHFHGIHRIKKGDDDATHGQKEVLSRYE